jgi:hypothetical protein
MEMSEKANCEEGASFEYRHYVPQKSANNESALAPGPCTSRQRTQLDTRIRFNPEKEPELALHRKI